MQINRLLEIVILLLNREKLTARQLAQRFSVSTRTIYRDIDALSLAGVPVYCTRGAGGGIQLMEGQVIGRALLSKDERESLMMAAQTLEAVQIPQAQTVLEKLRAVFGGLQEDFVEIDLSGFGAGPQEQAKLAAIKQAILTKHALRIEYASAKGERTLREVEPMRLVFKAHTWYVAAYCRLRSEGRLFRISRIASCQVLTEVFARRSLPLPEPDGPKDFPLVSLTLRFAPECLHRLYDEFPANLIAPQPDGGALVEVTYPEEEWVYGFLLSFGARVQVLSPARVRDTLRERALQVARLYAPHADPRLYF